MIRAVFFDLDDTLCDAASAFQAAVEAASALLLACRPDVAPGDLRRAWLDANTALLARLETGAMTMAEVRAARWPHTLARLGIGDAELAVLLDETLGRELLARLRLFDDALPALAALRPRYHIGILTNGADDAHPDSQRSKAAHLGLLERVDAFLTSDAAGVRKPDPRIFHQALRPLGLAPGECLYVGDSLVNDVAGANRARMVSVLLWRADAPLPALAGDARPAHMIRTLTELPGLITSV